MASGLTNSHEALLRNQHHLSGQVVLLGLQDAELLRRLAGPGHAMSEHQGVFHEALQAAPQSWQPAHGYDDARLLNARADTVVIFLPKARQELDLRLALARATLSEGGKLLLIGEKREGIAGAIKQLKTLDSNASKLDSARHCQLWQARPGPAPFNLSDWLS